MKTLEEQITMVRNFPRHVGDHDASLPETIYRDYARQAAFRDGWSYAVQAINDRITQMQNTGRQVRREEEKDNG